MRIGICEDNSHDAELLTSLISAFNDTLKADLYASSEQLLDVYAKGERYDLIFMDIRLPGMNGFDAARKIHREYHDDRPLIVFLTISDQYVFDAYNVGWDYVCKPINCDRIKKIFESADAELSQRKTSFHSTEGLFYLQTRDIFYYEAYYGVVTVSTNKGVFCSKSRLTLDEVKCQLGNRPFCVIHRSYIINLRNVTQHTQTKVHMTNGKVLAISKNRRKSFIESMENFNRGGFYG